MRPTASGWLFSEVCPPRWYALGMVPATVNCADSVEASALQTMTAARWPEGAQCPRCRSGTVSRRRRGWRCGSCRKDFTVITGTTLHGSKAPLSAWVDAAVSDADSAAVSDKTQRSIRSVVESTGLAAGSRRLAALLAAAPGVGTPGPLAGVGSGQRKILAVLRTRAAGATAGLVAAETGLSLSHVRRCLRTLRSDGFAETRSVSVMWGYRPQRLTLWRLAMNEHTIAALPQIGWSPPQPEPPPDGVPGEFWWLFWSGTCASRLRIPEDAVHIADTLIGGPDPAARAWALEMLPLWALQQLRTMRGYDTGEAARWLDFTIKQRQDVTDG